MDTIKSAMQGSQQEEHTSTPMMFPVMPTWSDKEKMRALRFHGTRDVRIDTVPRPLISHPKDAIVRITTTTICGSDLHLYHNSIPGMKSGDILGHEAVGIVHQVGPECSFKVGQRVVVSAVIACGTCRFCKEGRFSVCDHTNPSKEMEKQLGFRSAGLFGYSHLTGGYPGLQAEYARVPNADVNLLPIPDDVENERALALSDIACTGYHACMMGEVKARDIVGVWGCGPVGLMAIMHAKRLGAARVIAVDCVPERLALAAKLGAETINYKAIPSGSTVPTEFLLMAPGGADVTIEAVGFRYAKSMTHGIESALKMETDSIDALAEAMRCCRKGGTISVVGDFIGTCNHFPIGALMELNQTMRGGQLHTQLYWKTLLEAMRKGAFDPRKIYTHVMTLDDVPQGYAMMDAKSDGCVKIVVKVAPKEETTVKV
jgi:threonine dehydrogenase-like Zn-dependent dehydrogenase